ncbi:ABC transporter ATP-binding protein [Natrinema versiforme]|uniref:Molybdate/tungstate import ATP-binding protein WtpC n=1 Tax=Natrinema versiforme JCM 10478 TaxID=1227496 RepID=L9XUP2_9EURY|nr:ABC transporter ATP-binding protein [Natrinema versiforme]ELY65514.1 putrescine/spermidine ABC transporter ATPase protein [Natrinema versiforme JCM 10478]
MTVTEIAIESLQKSFRSETVLRDIELNVEKGEFCVVIGPSGCGKSTLLKCIAGLVDHEAGTVTLNGTDADELSVQERDIGFVFQEFEETLFAHKTVAENVAFGLEQQDREFTEGEIDDRIDEMLSMLAIEHTKDDYPGELSGGQQQRVELARQLVRECDVMLLDDPLADLDYKLQKRMELEMRQIHRSLGSTFIYVTHNQDQALTLADTLVVMNHGKIEQIGSPTEVYESPATAFTARFVGDSNVFVADGTVATDGDAVAVDTSIGTLEAVPRNGSVSGGDGLYLVRPESVEIGDDDCDTVITGTLEGRTYTGETTEFAFSIDGLDREFLAVAAGRPDVGTVGDDLALGWDRTDAWYFENISATDTVTAADLVEE